MPRAQTLTEPDVTEEEETRRAQILDAALECFVQLGIARTSVQDVARMAGVSRGTVYRYFDDRKVLIDAAVERGAQAYYRDAAAAMAKHDTLAKQVGAMAEVAVRTQIEHRTSNRLIAEDAELMRHLVSGSDATVRRSTLFLTPYVDAAKARGEISRATNVSEASEWLARIVHSLTNVRSSPNFDMTKPKLAAKFVTKYAVDGLR